MIEVTVRASVEKPAHTHAMTAWLVDRDYLPMSDYDMRRMFYPLLPHQFGEMPIKDVWCLCSRAVVYQPRVNPETFEPNRLIWWFPTWARDDALLFKLTFAGR